VLFGEEGDTLHTGARSLWLTSVVLLRCHKRRIACSIILCTYLDIINMSLAGLFAEAEGSRVRGGG
jgi:hypothetical protein